MECKYSRVSFRTEIDLEGQLSRLSFGRLILVSTKLVPFDRSSVSCVFQSREKMNSFLRVFPGRRTRSLSYARFPFAELDKVIQIICQKGWWHTSRVGCYELDGKHCFIDRRGDGFAIRRYNGEPYWNICLLNGNQYKNVGLETLKEIFEQLVINDISLILPKTPFEYISPITSEETEPYLERDSVWPPSEKMSIIEAQELEKEWNSNKNER